MDYVMDFYERKFLLIKFVRHSLYQAIHCRTESTLIAFFNVNKDL